MNYKDRSKIIFFKILSFFKPFALVFLIIALLQATGLLSTVSYAGQWAILQTGLKDASDEVSDADEKFDYEFTIKDMEGNKIDFSKFRNKVLFINVWATWCGPCRAEMASIQKLYDKINKDKVTFIMLSMDRDSDKGKIVSYLKGKGFTFGAYQPSGYLPKQLQVPSIPTTFIISKAGNIVRKEVGSMRYDTSKFQKFLEDLSAGQ
ncbi:MAG: TlpA family protein disulfide reductase [Cyclobacteriaceae bacterium]|nr:TlpA family protein disulfide reductase [Cyclobacteriaceae bacterium]